MARKFGDMKQSVEQSLPKPSQEELDHSEALASLIRQEIAAANGMLPFARFMELALYAPGLGYYAAGARKFGEAGDFVTAPEISPLFSRCLARQCLQVLAEIDDGNILEFGAGTGTMAADLLLELERCAALPARYYILELSPDLQQRQQETLRLRASHLFECVEWLSALPEPGFKGVVLANEVVDAMPVHLFQMTEGEVTEAYVTVEDEQFVWHAGPPSTPLIKQQVTSLQDSLGEEVFCDGYVSEINLAQHAWIASLSEFLTQGVALIIDYGFPQHEYYLPERTMGTLMCHYRHRAHSEPLIFPGLQDITSHVDFTALAETAHQEGFDVMGYTSQAQFLLGNGLTEMVAETNPDDTVAYMNVTQQVKKLTLPNEMGELFKVIAFGKDIDLQLNGFLLQDRRTSL